ncbi:MAG: hypothetical protein K6B64_04085 [Acholeplasmatales bacterium]|nr:hypothetical protein [Acholeplasmatales bacterium]
MKRQPSITTGGECIFSSVIMFLVMIFIFLVVFTPAADKGIIIPEIFIPVYMFAPFVLIFLIAGIISIVKYNKIKKLKETGKKSVCKIVNFKEYSGGRLHIVSHYMIVEYKSFSGIKYNLKVRISGEVVHKTKIGDMIVCYIQDELCYVDEEKIIVVNQ